MGSEAAAFSRGGHFVENPSGTLRPDLRSGRLNGRETRQGPDREVTLWNRCREGTGRSTDEAASGESRERAEAGQARLGMRGGESLPERFRATTESLILAQDERWRRA